MERQHFLFDALELLSLEGRDVGAGFVDESDQIDAFIVKAGEAVADLNERFVCRILLLRILLHLLILIIHFGRLRLLLCCRFLN